MFHIQEIRFFCIVSEIHLKWIIKCIKNTIGHKFNISEYNMSFAVFRNYNSMQECTQWYKDCAKVDSTKYYNNYAMYR